MIKNKWLTKELLKGNIVTLVPIKLQHAKGLSEAVNDGELWKLWYTNVPHPDSIEIYIREILAEHENGHSLAFTVSHNSNNKIIGCTRYCNVDNQNHRLEIGHTWYAESHQRTAVNTECKFLLLSHAFESLNAIAVEFRTSWHNLNSRKAIERLGAKQDGIIRNHRKLPNGGFRDTVIYSIIESEWPAVKASLMFRLNEKF